MIRIRHIQEEDLEPLKALVAANRERLSDSFPVTVQNLRTDDTARDFVNKRIQLALQRRSFYFMIFTEDTQALIGVLSIKEIDHTVPKTELAYFVDQHYEGKGIITQALQWLVRYAFEELKLARVYVRVHPDNYGSVRVAEKNGFVFEGVMQNDSRNGMGQLCDAAYYGLINKQTS